MFEAKRSKPNTPDVPKTTTSISAGPSHQPHATGTIIQSASLFPSAEAAVAPNPELATAILPIPMEIAPTVGEVNHLISGLHKDCLT